MGEYAVRIRARLDGMFSPSALEIEDQSARHAGHAGHDPRGETHFRVKMVSERFRGLSRVERHRLVHAALAAELAERVHALSLILQTPEEAETKHQENHERPGAATDRA
ncbi:MAG: BolA family transcriptional regulator [Pseudomonadota bacterium]|nr:BolA family transcriptional regulator [Pseudomonadota bacterium]